MSIRDAYVYRTLLLGVNLIIQKVQVYYILHEKVKFI